MKIDSHLENLRESVQEIERAVREGIEKKQRTIGFHTSSGAADMLEIILHKHNLVDPGFMVKHEWFNSINKLKEKINFDFPNKEKILELMIKIENVRNSLCYGKRRTEEELAPVIEDFHELTKLFKEDTGYEL